MLNGTPWSRVTSPSRARSLYPLLIPLVSMAVVSIAAVPSSAANQNGPLPMPKAQAFDGERPLSSIKEVTNLCKQGKGCSFTVDRVQEYRGGVISVGDSYLNCTSKVIYVTRSFSYQPTITDNIGGDISGTAIKTGSVENTSQVNLSGTATGDQSVRHTHETFVPNWADQISNSRDESRTEGRFSGTISGYTEGSQTAEKSFENSATRSYSRTWENSISSETEISPSVHSGDVLTVGYVGTGHRITGTLKAVGTSKYVKNVTFDEPSFAEASAFVAQTYTAPKGSCNNNRPTGRAAQLFKVLGAMNAKPRDAVAGRKK